jgi:MinD-like ATPase involved in chromosome partitioning or flagellar assembly
VSSISTTKVKRAVFQLQRSSEQYFQLQRSSEQYINYKVQANGCQDHVRNFVVTQTPFVVSNKSLGIFQKIRNHIGHLYKVTKHLDI